MSPSHLARRIGRCPKLAVGVVAPWAARQLGGLLAGALLALSPGCGPGTTSPDAGGNQGDAGTDAGADAGTDAGLDAGVDAGRDGGGGVRALLSVSPAKGGVAGGTALELRGEGFVSGLGVQLGGALCSNLVVVSPKIASCVSPPKGDGQAGVVDLVARWPDGFTDTLAGGFSYELVSQQVDYLQLLLPQKSGSVPAGQPVPVEVLVFEAGLTEGAGAAAGMQLEAGFGPPSEDPSLAPAAYSFAALAFLRDVDGLSPGDLANEVWGSALPAPTAAGRYRLAARASLDGGASWRYADLGGSDDGFDPTALPEITIAPAGGVVLDGILDEAAWSAGVEATQSLASDWSGNSLTHLRLLVADSTLYLGVEGSVTTGNALVVYVDAALGQAGGVADPTLLSDGVGTLDDALSSALSTPATFSVDFAWGSLDLGRGASGFDDRMGWRDLMSNPADFGWLDSALAPTVCSASACEASIPLSSLGASTGVDIAAFARLVNGSGQQAANQTLPTDQPATPTQVSALLQVTP